MRGIKRIVTGFFLTAVATTGQAQKQTTTYKQVWAGAATQARLTHKLGLWMEVQLRTKDDFLNDLSVVFFRPGITYYINDVTKLTAGYGYFRHYPMDGHTIVVQPEHRPWQQIQWHTTYPRVRTMQYVRLEERYRRKILNDSTLAEGSHFNYRVRYNFLLQVPFKRKPLAAGDLSFILNNEVQVNFGKEIVNNYFDQNRFFTGLAWNLNAQDNIQIGYMNVFQQLPSGNQYRSIHAARVFYFHNLDLRAKN